MRAWKFECELFYLFIFKLCSNEFRERKKKKKERKWSIERKIRWSTIFDNLPLLHLAFQIHNIYPNCITDPNYRSYMIYVIYDFILAFKGKFEKKKFENNLYLRWKTTCFFFFFFQLKFFMIICYKNIIIFLCDENQIKVTLSIQCVNSIGRLNKSNEGQSWKN